MGKLLCPCGHLIIDQTDNIPNKGYILPDTEIENISTSLLEAIDSLSAATRTEKRQEWIEKNFSFLPDLSNMSDADMIYDLLTRKLAGKTQDIFECGNCGRIAVQVKQTSRFHFFSPDVPKAKGILNSKK